MRCLGSKNAIYEIKNFSKKFVLPPEISSRSALASAALHETSAFTGNFFISNIKFQHVINRLIKSYHHMPPFISKKEYFNFKVGFGFVELNGDNWKKWENSVVYYFE